MTNPISKAIVKAAVAMGYGKKSDYKGSSVADVLEKFASIAKDKGGSGGVEDIEGAYIGNHKYTVNKPISEIVAAMQQGARIRARQEATIEGVTQGASVYLNLLAIYYRDNTITTMAVFAPYVEDSSLMATESDGVTTFAPA